MAQISALNSKLTQRIGKTRAEHITTFEVCHFGYTIKTKGQ